MSHTIGLRKLNNRTENNETTEIPLPKRKIFSRLVFPAAIIVIALILLAYSARDSLLPAIPVQTVSVVVKNTAITSSGSVTVQAPGWVEADPFSVYVPTLIPGIVKEVLVLEGESVKTGQVIARLVDDDARLALNGTKARLAEAEARLDSAQASLTAAQGDWDHPIELDRALAIAKAQRQETEASISVSESDIQMHQLRLSDLEDHYKRLSHMGTDVVSPRAVTEALFKQDAQKATLTSAQEKLEMIKAQLTISEADFQAAQQHRALRINQRKTLDESKANLAANQALVERLKNDQAIAELALERTEIRSPMNGVVLRRHVVPGSKVRQAADKETSANVIQLYDPNKLQVRVDIPLADAAAVGLDQFAEVVVDVLPDVTFKGKVTRIVQEADIQKNTMQVKVAIEKPVTPVKPEMLARVKFLANVIKTDASNTSFTVFVPERLLQNRSGNTATVWINSANKALQKEITLGTTKEAGWIQVLTGLNQGDKLITDANGTLKDGSRLRVTGQKDN